MRQSPKTQKFYIFFVLILFSCQECKFANMLGNGEQILSPPQKVAKEKGGSHNPSFFVPKSAPLIQKEKSLTTFPKNVYHTKHEKFLQHHLAYLHLPILQTITSRNYIFGQEIGKQNEKNTLFQVQAQKQQKKPYQFKLYQISTVYITTYIFIGASTKPKKNLSFLDHLYYLYYLYYLKLILETFLLKQVFQLKELINHNQLSQEKKQLLILTVQSVSKDQIQTLPLNKLVCCTFVGQLRSKVIGHTYLIYMYYNIHAYIYYNQYTCITSMWLQNLCFFSYINYIPLSKNIKIEKSLRFYGSIQ
eukprot:TRINITY_DN34288_c2_g4_i3.p1 TRINITY_DN34288_c2_g4~~TRINITY_DN34288_c2_g4_i3.p1  ORF type:complete len:304 (-),score=-16.01 TRINITY_DN34288_c2_g4_i3:79-990(-)